jgi:hypothetical protein
MQPPADLPAQQCVAQLLAEAQRLGVQIRWQQPSPQPLVATYHAQAGQPGTLVLPTGDPPPSTTQLCTLLTHEMVHVLQHWRGHFQAVLPLGWPTDGVPASPVPPHEAEAFTAQGDPQRVLNALRQLQPPPPR